MALASGAFSPLTIRDKNRDKNMQPHAPENSREGWFYTGYMTPANPETMKVSSAVRPV